MPLDLSTLSAEQKDAVTAPLGPVLVLAGAGSGKTRVLTHRAAHLVSDVGAFPREIVALTFTNKAAREMRQRIKELVPGETPFFGTFHAWALLMLRRHGARLGLPQPFAVLAGSEQGEALRRAAKAAGIVIEAGKTGPILREISRQKSGMAPEWSPSLQNVDVDKLAAAYQKECRRLGAIDFDDMLLLLRDLLSGDAEVREKLRTRTPHVLVDEFQDTNRLQYEILRLLRPPGESQGSLFAVGDDDQSIYAFRGATIGNILAFERDYPGTRVFHLAANYRSSAEILDCATHVVRVNKGRKEKRLVAHRGPRRKVEVVVHATDSDEARWVAREIESGAGKGSAAVLYRTNGQSRLFEESLTALGIRYRIVGALRFYERREVKDVLAYLSAALMPRDEIAFARAIATPPRGVGDATRKLLEDFARARGETLAGSLRPFLAENPQLPSRAREGLGAFADVLDAIRAAGPGAGPMIDVALRLTSYLSWIRSEPGGDERAENVKSLAVGAAEFDAEQEAPDAAAFLAYASLETGDDGDEGGDAPVSLLTMHAAKGLEFATVYLVGLEEGLVPHSSSTASAEDLAEERRLLYVGMTRARDRLVLTHASSRRLYGKTDRAIASRFLADIPKGSSTVVDLAPEQDPAARFERAFAFLGTRKASEPFTPRDRERPRAAPRDAATARAVASVAVPYGIGTRVRHDKYGVGTVLGREGDGDDLKLTITFFGGVGRKKMIVKYANLTILP